MTLWVALLARLVLAAVWLVAGGSKVGDLAASVRAVHAYQIVPYGASEVIGVALPFVEIGLGLFLLAGFATRLVAGLSTGMLALFVAGITAAWVRGLNIDCGCFGGGGALAEGESPSYLWEVLRDLALLGVAGWLLFRPLSRLALDNIVMGSGVDDEDRDDEAQAA